MEATEGEERGIGPEKGGLGLSSLKCCWLRHRWLATSLPCWRSELLLTDRPLFYGTIELLILNSFVHAAYEVYFATERSH